MRNVCFCFQGLPFWHRKSIPKSYFVQDAFLDTLFGVFMFIWGILQTKKTMDANGTPYRPSGPKHASQKLPGSFQHPDWRLKRPREAPPVTLLIIFERNWNLSGMIFNDSWHHFLHYILVFAAKCRTPAANLQETSTEENQQETCRTTVEN